MISDKYNFMFVHVPKCAGTSVVAAIDPGKALSEDSAVDVEPFAEGHWTLAEYRGMYYDDFEDLRPLYSKFNKRLAKFWGPEKPAWLEKDPPPVLTPERYGEYFKFGFVRNPFARFISAYHYAKMEVSYYHSIHGWGAEIGDQKDEDDKKRRYGYHLDYDRLKDASIADAAKMLVKGQLKHSLKWNHWRPVSYWTHVQGECGLDFVGRVENLGEDLPQVCEKIGLPVSAVPHINTSKHGHYTEYLDDEPKARDMLAQYYWQDLESFGYEY